MQNPQLRKLRANQILFKEGDPANAIYVVMKGTLSIRKMKTGGYVEIAKIFPNEIVGELSFFDRKPRSASAVAISDVELTEVDFGSLDKIYQAIPSYFKTIFACVSDRLRKSTETIRRLAKDVTPEPKKSKPQDHEELAAAITLSPGEGVSEGGSPT